VIEDKMAIGVTKDPAGNITANPFATGKPKFGAGQTNNATSGKLGSTGYTARDAKKKKATSAAIAAILPPAKADPNAAAATPAPAASTGGAKPAFGSPAWRALYAGK
jgi:hypothetical protein